MVCSKARGIWFSFLHVCYLQLDDGYFMYPKYVAAITNATIKVVR